MVESGKVVLTVCDRMFSVLDRDEWRRVMDEKSLKDEKRSMRREL